MVIRPGFYICSTLGDVLALCMHVIGAAKHLGDVEWDRNTPHSLSAACNWSNLHVGNLIPLLSG